jgi:hypothetical protein
MDLGWGSSCLDSREWLDDRVLMHPPAGTSHESPDFRFNVCPSKSSLALPEMTYPTVSYSLEEGPLSLPPGSSIQMRIETRLPATRYF